MFLSVVIESNREIGAHQVRFRFRMHSKLVRKDPAASRKSSCHTAVRSIRDMTGEVNMAAVHDMYETSSRSKPVWN